MPSPWEKLRADFSLTRQYTYLDHAAGGPMPRPVVEAVERYYRELAGEADFAWPKWMSRREKARESAARFIGADPDETAFITSTSHGMNLIAELLAPEGTVLTSECEFPSSTVPWIHRKADLVFQKAENFRVCLTTLKEHLNPGIKTILTSQVQYATGFRQDLEALGLLKGDRYLVVNGSQGMGAFPVDVRSWQADFFCSNSYKWMLAGYGGGILFIRRELLSLFEPLSAGWRSMTEPERMDNRRIALRPDAARNEWGCPNFAAEFALGAAVEYMEQIGREAIRDRILELTDFAAEAFREKGFEILSPRGPGEGSGILICRMPDADTLWKRLLGDGIFVTARGEGLRIAPHFYNTFDEIEKLLRKLIEYRSL